MNKLREGLRRVAKNPVLILALAILLAGIWISYLSNSGGLPLVASSAASAANFSDMSGDDVDFGSAGTVQGVHTSQNPGAGANQQNNLNGNSGGSGPLSVHPSAPPSSQPIIIEPDPLPIMPVSPCKYLLQVPKDQCHPICNPCGNDKQMMVCPLYEGSAPVRYPCSPCGYPVNSDIVCRPIEGTPIGQL